jgi:UDP-N-acetylmuramoyl-L-alanyl-D-glutamate--2,6-diaminopimelate ligase
MKLSHIIHAVKHLQIIGNTDVEITAIVFDSRKAVAGTMFVALKGEVADGHNFISKAIDSGCSVIVSQKEIKPTAAFGDTLEAIIQTPDTHEALGWLAANFYENPSHELKLVGITGTNGKTTTATLLYRLTQSMGYPTGLLSTVENRINETVFEATHTTPDAVTLNEMLRKMVDAGCEYAFMEVSSHALVQHRTAGVQFSGAVFSNISHDHLDYHKTMQAYIYAKKKLFDDLPKGAFALVNKDDKRGEVMLQNCAAAKHTYALRSPADFKAKIMENLLSGLHLDLDGADYYGKLIGEFNAYNTLAVYATALLLGLDKTETLAALSNLASAEGRFEYIRNETKNIIGIVDYAHTPDALEKVLKTIEQFKGNGKVITVVGCGGDRDDKKRPIMAAHACDYSNTVILTSDNPRTEDPFVILKQMEAGVLADKKHKVITIENREQAIKTACHLAQNDDIILVAGKGHEKYQDIMGVKYPFDDKAVLVNWLIGEERVKDKLVK